MEDALVQGLTALGALTAVVILAVLVGVVGLVFVDWWENCRDLRYAKGLVRNNLHKPLSVCTCAAIPGFGPDPVCPIHGMPDPPCRIDGRGEVCDSGPCTPKCP